MFDRSKLKIWCSSSITNRWTSSSSFDVWKMIFEFVQSSIKWCSTHHYKIISYVLISFPSKAGNISTLTLILVPWYSTMRYLIVSKSSSIKSQIGRKFSLLKNMYYELVAHTVEITENSYTFWKKFREFNFHII